MISVDHIAAVVILGCCLFLVYALVVRPLLGLRQRPMHERPEEERNLNALHVRRGLSDFLARHRIVGSADIRDGEVLPAVSVERLYPLAIRLDNAYSVLRRLPNPAASSLYVRDSVSDKFRLLDLDVEDIGETVRLLQMVERQLQEIAKERTHENRT